MLFYNISLNVNVIIIVGHLDNIDDCNKGYNNNYYKVKMIYTLVGKLDLNQYHHSLVLTDIVKNIRNLCFILRHSAISVYSQKFNTFFVKLISH